MTEIDDLLALLPNVEDITGYELPAQPGASTGQILAYGRIKEILELMASQGGGSGAGNWIPLSRHGGVKDSSTDNTDAFESAIEESIEIGSPGVYDDLVPDEVGDFIALEGRAYFQMKDFLGQAPKLTQVRCVDAGAGMDFSHYDDTLNNTGRSAHFAVWGGDSPGNGIATRPLVIGKRVNARFSNIHSWYADPETGSNAIIESTQNSLFDTMWLVDSAEPLKFDRGASGNHFNKGEIAAGHVHNLAFRHTDDEPPGQFPYNGDNTVSETIIEATWETTENMVYASASALCQLLHCYISVNGPVFGGDYPTAMVQVILAEAVESVQASLMLFNCQVTGNNHADVGVEANNTDGSRIHLHGGSMGTLPLGVRGNVIVEAEPWFFSTVTQKYDLTGLFTAAPRMLQHVPRFHFAAAGTDLTNIAQVAGDANVSTYNNARGTRFYGNGTAATDTNFGRLAAGIVGTTTALACGGNYLAPMCFGNYRMWVDFATGKVYIKNGTPSSATDGTVIGTQT